jgi:hypothetical protein
MECASCVVSLWQTVSHGGFQAFVAVSDQVTYQIVKPMKRTAEKREKPRPRVLTLSQNVRCGQRDKLIVWPEAAEPDELALFQACAMRCICREEYT